MTAIATPIAAPAPTARSTRRWVALSVLALAQFLVVLDASIVNIALPVLGEHLQMETATLAWVITAYVLPFGGLLLLGGKLADSCGHRKLFLIGTAGFVAASTSAGFSISSGMLLTARAVQGASAALLAPAALALVTQLFPEAKDRSKALGIWGAVAGIGSAAGVLLGGVLTSAFGWQAVFFVNLPIGVIVLAAVPALVTRDTTAAATRLDYPGAATITGALVATVGALSAVEQVGFFRPLPLGLIAAALVLGVVFVLIERRTAEPLVPLAVFRNRSLTAGNLVMLLVGAAMVALFFALSVYLQAVLGYDALTAGLTQLPLAGALVVVAGVVPGIVNKAGLKPTLIGALVTLAGGLGWLAAAPSNAAFAVHLLGPSILIGIGLGGAFVTTTQFAVDGVDSGEAGLAGGLVNTSQQIGGALGLAVLASIATVRTGALEAAGTPSADALTAGFSWVFLGAATFALTAAGIASLAPLTSRGVTASTAYADGLPRWMRRATTIRRASPSRLLTTVAWFAAGVSVLLFVSANGLSRVDGIESVVNATGIAAGGAGTTLMLTMLLLAARLPIIDRLFGQGTAMVAHRHLGQPAFYLVLAHGILLSFGMNTGGGGSAAAVIQSMSDGDLLLAYLSVVLLVFVIVCSLAAVTRRLPYEVWHVIHLVTYAALLVALPHQFTPGGILSAGAPQQVLWIAFYGLAFGSIAWFRMLLPVVRSLRHRMRVSSVDQIANDVFSVHLTGRNLDRLRVEGGQFAVWRFWTSSAWWHAHPLSFSAMPTATGARVTFRVVGNGTAALRRAPVGTAVWFEGPYGRFTRSAQVTRRVSIAAAGIGVTPIRAILEQHPYRAGEATILLRATSAAQAHLWDEVEELASAAGITVTRMIGHRPAGASTWMSEDAFESGSRIDTVFPDPTTSDLYVCGPTAWSELVVRDALAAGVPRAQIHVEGFSSAQRGGGRREKARGRSGRRR